MKRWGIEKPDRDWLAMQYLLPPKGLGRSTRKLAKELGVSRKTIQRWVAFYRLTEPQLERISMLRKGIATWRKKRPDAVWLAKQYQMPPDGLGRTLQSIAEELQVSLVTLRKWLEGYGLTQQFIERHSQRMSATGNPAYKNGTSRNYHKNVLVRSGKAKICEWCGHSEKVQVHHIDHDTENGNLDNLMWLCHNCNILEAHLWALRESGRAIVKVIDGQITVQFRTGNQEE
jgi:transcriptional regulator with XRE-family HTH domain